MLDDSIYDIIIVEYDQRRFGSLAVFAMRLHQRFPNTAIILIKMQNLMDITIEPNSSRKVEKLREWLVKSSKLSKTQEALE